MGRLLELARQRLTQWMDANPRITQVAVGRAIGHTQAWVSRFRQGAQDADVDELDGMARVYGHTLAELLDLRPDPKEQKIIDAYRKVRAEARPLVLPLLEQMILPPAPPRGRTRGRSDE